MADDIAKYIVLFYEGGLVLSLDQAIDNYSIASHKLTDFVGYYEDLWPQHTRLLLKNDFLAARTYHLVVEEMLNFIEWSDGVLDRKASYPEYLHPECYRQPSALRPFFTGGGALGVAFYREGKQEDNIDVLFPEYYLKCPDC